MGPILTKKITDDPSMTKLDLPYDSETISAVFWIIKDKKTIHLTIPFMIKLTKFACEHNMDVIMKQCNKWLEENLHVPLQKDEVPQYYSLFQCSEKIDNQRVARYLSHEGHEKQRRSTILFTHSYQL